MSGQRRIEKSSGETLRRYSVESAPINDDLLAVRRVTYSNDIRDGQVVFSRTETHQFVVAASDHNRAHQGVTPASATQLFALTPELVDLIPRLDDASPTKLEDAAREHGLGKHDLAAFKFPFSAVIEGQTYTPARWDQAYGWQNLTTGTYLAQPVLMGPKTGLTARNYNFERLLDLLRKRDDVSDPVCLQDPPVSDHASLVKAPWLSFAFYPDQDLYNRLVDRSKTLVAAGYPCDLAYALFDLDPLGLQDAGAIKVTNLHHLMGRFDLPNIEAWNKTGGDTHDC